MKNFITLTLAILFILFSPAAFTQSVETHKSDIYSLHASAAASHNKLKDKIRIKEENRHLEYVKKEILDYYDLAVKLEKSGHLEQANKCYERIDALTSDKKMKNYIKRRKKALKKLAQEEKKLLMKEMKELRKTQEMKQAKKNQTEHAPSDPSESLLIDKTLALESKIKAIEKKKSTEKNKEFL